MPPQRTSIQTCGHHYIVQGSPVWHCVTFCCQSGSIVNALVTCAVVYSILLDTCLSLLCPDQCDAQWTIMIACLVQLFNDGDFPANRVHNLRSFWWFSSHLPLLLWRQILAKTLIPNFQLCSKFIKSNLDLKHPNVFPQHSTSTFLPWLWSETKQSSILQNFHF